MLMRDRLGTFSEELAAKVEGKLVEQPTLVEALYNNTLKDAIKVSCRRR
jgi:hypothetical protein